MKTNHHNRAFTCATSRVRNTSGMCFLTKLLAVFAVSLFAFVLAAPDGTAQTSNKADADKNKDLQVTLCTSLQKLDSSVEVRGERRNLLFLKTTFKQSSRGGKSKSGMSGDGKYLFVVRLIPDDGYGIDESSNHETTFSRNWRMGIPGRYGFLDRREGYLKLTATAFEREHPDGTGYVTTWSPSWGPLLIVVTTSEECKAFFQSIDDYYWKQVKPLEKDWERVDLGEMTKEEVAQKFRKIHDHAKANIWPKALKWAEGL